MMLAMLDNFTIYLPSSVSGIEAGEFTLISAAKNICFWLKFGRDPAINKIIINRETAFLLNQDDRLIKLS
jgi:hypothetical protein